MSSKPSSPQPNKLAVILPSRGLMFSQTFEELLNELEGFYYEIYWAHERPLPDCFNEPLAKILKDKTVFAVLLCEDDMIIPKGVLKKMFAANYPAVALDYPFKANGDSTMIHAPNGDVIYSGTGFMLLAKAVLEGLPKPVFRTDTSWDMFIKNRTLLLLWPRKLKKIAYGLHDQNLGVTLFSTGLPIKDLGITAGQRKLVKLGNKGSNNGTHAIKELKYVGRDMVIKTVNEEHINMFLSALRQVKTVEVRMTVPDFIHYVDGQAVPKPGLDMEYQIV